MRMVAAMLSKPGGVEPNTDALACRADGHSLDCWVVVDGRGDDGGGAVVARRAANTLLKVFTENPAVSTTVLSKVFEWAHRDLLSLQTARPENKSMRASAGLFCTGGRSALWAHIGDVRIYAFRDGAIIFQSIDHSIPQGMVKAGELEAWQIRGHGERHRLMRALGAEGTPRPSILGDRFILKPGDLFLLCTDGFWEHVTEAEMQIDWCKSATVQQWLEHMEARLLRAAPEGRDCYSAIALLAEP